MQTATHRISYEQSLEMPENKLEEILDGESRIMPPPTLRHYGCEGTVSLTNLRHRSHSRFPLAVGHSRGQ